MSDKKKRAQSWNEKVFEADGLWEQLKNILTSNALNLPLTPRRPDVRMIIDNKSGIDQLFRNPGDHSSKAENIPAAGAKTAAMIMVNGKTLTEQFENAQKLSQKYNLSQEGLSKKFVAALASGEALDLVKEAYGPAPFDEQVAKLEEIEWVDLDGHSERINPVKGNVCAYGARLATNEKAFRVEIPVFVKGSTTTPELLEGEGMVVAVSEDWKTKEESTRPIAPSVAKEFYGEHYDSIPVVTLTHDGLIQKVDLRDGIEIDLVFDYQVSSCKPGIA